MSFLPHLAKQTTSIKSGISFFLQLAVEGARNTEGPPILNIIRCFGLAALCMTLTACNTEQQDISLESRTIAVEQNAEPTSAGAVDSVSHLLPMTGPTYVTITVTEYDRFKTEKEQTKRALTSGSGCVVDGSGYVMTAAHVAVNKGNLVSARAANGKIYSGSVIDVNPANDMAVIKLRGYSGTAATPSTQSCMAQGALVYTLGKPQSQGDTARVGALDTMHFGRPVVYGRFGYPDAMVLRMSTRKGESGGPVFDSQGKLVGMVVSTLSDQNGNSINLAHAVYASSLARFLCTHMNCSSAWANVAQQSPEKC